MGKNWIRILAPLIFCFYVCAFMELEFGGRVEQSWTDEYDTYAISSKVSCPGCHSFSLNHSVDLAAADVKNLFNGKMLVAENITSGLRITPETCKVFIKHEALLL
jgi:hypothetical protein